MRVLLIALLLAMTTSANANPLAAYRWQNRPLIVFAPASDDARLAEQMRALNDARAGLKDRDQVVLVVTSEGIEPALGPDPDGASAEAATALRERFGIGPNDFAVILVGKDGTEKLRETEPLSTESLFGTIDAMPMRRREMREGTTGDTPRTR